MLVRIVEAIFDTSAHLDTGTSK